MIVRTWTGEEVQNFHKDLQNFRTTIFERHAHDAIAADMNAEKMTSRT